MIIRSNIVMVLALGAVLWMSAFLGGSDSLVTEFEVEANSSEWNKEIRFVLVNADNRPVLECLIAFRLLPPFDHVMNSLRTMGKGIAELLEYIEITHKSESLLSVNLGIK